MVAGKKVYKLATLNTLTSSNLLPLAASSCSVLTAATFLRVSFLWICLTALSTESFVSGPVCARIAASNSVHFGAHSASVVLKSNSRRLN